MPTETAHDERPVRELIHLELVKERQSKALVDEFLWFSNVPPDARDIRAVAGSVLRGTNLLRVAHVPGWMAQRIQEFYLLAKDLVAIVNAGDVRFRPTERMASDMSAAPGRLAQHYVYDRLAIDADRRTDGGWQLLHATLLILRLFELGAQTEEAANTSAQSLRRSEDFARDLRQVGGRDEFITCLGDANPTLNDLDGLAHRLGSLAMPGEDDDRNAMRRIASAIASVVPHCVQHPSDSPAADADTVGENTQAATGDRVARWRDIQHHFNAAAYAEDRRGAENQFLPSSTTFPSNADLYTLAAILNGKDDGFTPQDRWIVLAITLLGLHALRPLKDGNAAWRDFLDHVHINEQTWSVRIPQPADAHKLSKSEKSLNEDVRDALELDLPELLSVWGQGIKIGELRTLDSKSYCSDLNRRLGKFTAPRGRSLTLHRVAHAVPRFLLHITDDPVEVDWIAGTQLASNLASAYYYTTTARRLRELYRQAAGALLLQIRMDSEFPPENKSHFRYFVGAALRPRLGVAQHFVDSLKRPLDRRIRIDSDADRIIAFHNALTRYVGHMFLAGTAARPLNELLASWDDVDLEDGLVLLSDKDLPFARSTRVVGLPAMLQRQIVAYRTHQRALRRVPSLAAAAQDAGLFLFADREDAQQGRLTTIPVTASALGVGLPSEQWPFPANTLRHLYRSVLPELEPRGGSELLSYAMGHFGAHQAPDDPYSSAAPYLVAREQRRRSEALLNTLKFKVIRGLSG